MTATRQGQAFVIKVNVQNKATAPVNAFTVSLTWLDGGHPRGGEFGVDAPDGHVLIEPGKTYAWTTTVQSTAVTKPLTALALRSTIVSGGEWVVPPGTLPLTVK